MDKNRPLVSIGIPVFNSEKTISRAVESALHQTYKNIEIIISDNFSKDSTKKICEEIALKHSRVKLILQSSNKGPEYNFKSVFDASSGLYFMWLAADDYIDSNYIQELLKPLLHSSASNGNINHACGVPIMLGTKSSFTGSCIDYSNNYSLLRLLKYALVYSEGSLLYGLFNRSALTPLMINKKNRIYENYGGDYFLMYEYLLKNKSAHISTTKIYRSAVGASSKFNFQYKIKSEVFLTLHIILFPFRNMSESHSWFNWIICGFVALINRPLRVTYAWIKITIKNSLSKS